MAPRTRSSAIGQGGLHLPGQCSGRTPTKQAGRQAVARRRHPCPHQGTDLLRSGLVVVGSSPNPIHRRLANSIWRTTPRADEQRDNACAVNLDILHLDRWERSNGLTKPSKNAVFQGSGPFIGNTRNRTIVSHADQDGAAGGVCKGRHRTIDATELPIDSHLELHGRPLPSVNQRAQLLIQGRWLHRDPLFVCGLRRAPAHKDGSFVQHIDVTLEDHVDAPIAIAGNRYLEVLPVTSNRHIEHGSVGPQDLESAASPTRPSDADADQGGTEMHSPEPRAIEGKPQVTDALRQALVTVCKVPSVVH